MAIKSLLILNKAGGLIYHRDFGESMQKLDSNDYLVIAGTFHSLHALTARISPTNSKGSGLLQMEMPTTTLHCFQTITGLKFLVVTDRNQANVGAINSKIYQLFADYVMKNPFYSLEMPVRCAKFDRNLEKYVVQIV